MLGILQANKRIFDFKNWKKKLKNVRMWRFFQILTHSNYEYTDGIELEFFTQVLCREYYNKPKN